VTAFFPAITYNHNLTPQPLPCLHSPHHTCLHYMPSPLPTTLFGLVGLPPCTPFHTIIYSALADCHLPSVTLAFGWPTIQPLRSPSVLPPDTCWLQRTQQHMVTAARLFRVFSPLFAAAILRRLQRTCLFRDAQQRSTTRLARACAMPARLRIPTPDLLHRRLLAPYLPEHRLPATPVSLPLPVVRAPATFTSPACLPRAGYYPYRTC